MSLGLYMDVHVNRAITDALRRRQIDVLTAQQDGSARMADRQLLTRASSLQRILFSQDSDLLAEAHHRQQTGEFFAGLVFAAQRKLTIGQIVDDLLLLTSVFKSDEMANRVIHLPLR